MAVALTPCSAPPALAGTMSLTGQEKFETAPTDKRFPTTNQAKHCYMCAARCPGLRSTPFIFARAP